MPRRPSAPRERLIPTARSRRAARAVACAAGAAVATAVAVPVAVPVEGSPSDRRLPAHLAALVNPAVLARRDSLVAARLQDAGAERVRLRRCAEIVAQHLLKSHSDA